jgi:hypothetical protein
MIVMARVYKIKGSGASQMTPGIIVSGIHRIEANTIKAGTSGLQ